MRSGAVLEAPTFVSGLDDVAVVREAVQQDRRHLGIAEDARPFGRRCNSAHYALPNAACHSALENYRGCPVCAESCGRRLRRKQRCVRQRLPRRRDQRTRLRLPARDRAAKTPHRAGPSGVADKPRDDMQVKLAHDVAERADIDLVGLRMRLAESGGQSRLFNEPRAVARLEVRQLDEAFAPGDQNELGPARVVHQQHARERQVGDGERVPCEPLVEREAHADHACPCGPLGRPSLAATVSAMSASDDRAPIGPAGAPAPKATIGKCSRV